MSHGPISDFLYRSVVEPKYISFKIPSEIETKHVGNDQRKVTLLSIISSRSDISIAIVITVTVEVAISVVIIETM